MSVPKLKPGERRFVISLTIREEGESSVVVEETGEPNWNNVQLPEGIFGVREGLRVAGNLVRELYNSRQRKLLLRERAAQVEQRRRDRKQQAPGKTSITVETVQPRKEEHEPPLFVPASTAEQPLAQPEPELEKAVDLTEGLRRALAAGKEARGE